MNNSKKWIIIICGLSLAGLLSFCSTGQTEEQPEETVETVETEVAAEERSTETETESEMESASENTTTVDSTPDSTESGVKIEGAAYADGDRRFATSGTKFILTGADDLSQVDYLEYRVGDSTYNKYNAAEPIQLSDEGLQRIVYRGVDRVGNIEPENQYEVTIDNTPPDVNHNLEGPFFDREGNRYVSGNTRIVLTASDRYSGVKKTEYSTNGSAFAEDMQPVDTTESGEMVLKYRAVDNLGNTSEEKTVTLFVDNAAPVVEITSSLELIDIDGVNYTRSDNSFGIRATDDDSGIARVDFRINQEGEFVPYTTRLQFDKEGKYTIEAKAVDHVGNVSEVKSVTFSVDNTPPRSNLKKANGESETPAE